jgi:hypothetical protein
MNDHKENADPSGALDPGTARRERRSMPNTLKPYSIPHCSATAQWNGIAKPCSSLDTRVVAQSLNWFKGPCNVEKRLRNIWLLPFALTLASCSGGGTDTGAASGGATPFTGKWYVVATLNVNVGGTATVVTDTTQFIVGAAGNAVLTGTDSQCRLDISVNNNILNYQTTCVFSATSATGSSTTSSTAACVLTVRTQAPIRGPQGSAKVSGSFGPKTEVCSGAAVSYSGNLVGAEGTAPTSGGSGIVTTPTSG